MRCFLAGEGVLVTDVQEEEASEAEKELSGSPGLSVAEVMSVSLVVMGVSSSVCSR